MHREEVRHMESQKEKLPRKALESFLEDIANKIFLAEEGCRIMADYIEKCGTLEHLKINLENQNINDEKISSLLHHLSQSIEIDPEGTLCYASRQLELLAEFLCYVKWEVGDIVKKLKEGMK
jgi:hypothetical protein